MTTKSNTQARVTDDKANENVKQSFERNSKYTHNSKSPNYVMIGESLMLTKKYYFNFFFFILRIQLPRCSSRPLTLHTQAFLLLFHSVHTFFFSRTNNVFRVQLLYSCCCNIVTHLLIKCEWLFQFLHSPPLHLNNPCRSILLHTIAKGKTKKT